MILRNKKFIAELVAIVLGVGVLIAHPAFAQDFEDFARTAGFSTQDDITVIIARLIRTAISFVGVVAVVFVLIGGFMWMTSGGNTDRLKRAKSILTNAVIGLIIVFASFAIVQFVLGTLTSSTDSTISQSESSPYTFIDSGGGPTAFFLQSVNTQCAQALRNLELQFVFSKNVDRESVESGIVVSVVDGADVDGEFEISGRRVTFRPIQTCPAPNEALNCFGPLTDYSIEIDSREVESSAGGDLICNTLHPCYFEFTTGSDVDVSKPAVVMDAPDSGQSVYYGDIERLQALTRDDSGVSTVDFYVIDDEEAIYTSGLEMSTNGGLLGGNEPNVFSTDVEEEWDTSGYLTNERYSIWARGSDCAGNRATAERVSIVLRAANCNNGVLDADFGETEIDCGGDDPLSAYYCGECDGAECSDDSDCATGHCENGFCVVVPRIEEVSPGNGAIGNYVTIFGEGFGNSEGDVVFLGASIGEDDKTTDAVRCNDSTQWSDSQIIVEVPQGAVDGPIMVRTSDAQPKTDRTDDDYGPSIADFDVNAIVRPGICELVPSRGVVGANVNAYGNGFGNTRGSSSFYFTDRETSSYLSWSDDELSVVVPNVDAREYRAQVFSGDFICVAPDGLPTEVFCSQDSDCDSLIGETCATKWCSQTLEYCSQDNDCAQEGGECESIRSGSNLVRFDVLDALTTTVPAISYIDTGWRACLGGDDVGEHCASDEDCSDSACETAQNWGPPGQYVTIFGTNFGSAIGSVRLNAIGNEALADTSFPAACEADYWSDSQITVIVPDHYLNGRDIDFISHSLTVVRADGAVSQPTDLLVLDDSAGPAMCLLDPSAGPVGTDVVIYGDNFGAARGSVKFYDNQTATVGVWRNDEVRGVGVPADSQTGPVAVIESVNGYASNPLNFQVGDCTEDAALCAIGQTCCYDGTCSASCETAVNPISHYAFKISTGITPLNPKIVVACNNDDGVSPTPWEGWSLPEDICLNSQIEADFDMPMNQSTLNSSTILVEACADFFSAAEEDDGLGEEGACQRWTAQSASSINTDARGFSWIPASSLAAGTLYRVTVDGLDSLNDTQSVASASGGQMQSDFSWEFTTRATSDNCEVGGVNVRPSVYSTSAQGVDIPYSAQLVAANDMCVALSCTGYDIAWSSDFSGAQLASYAPPRGVCQNSVKPMVETPVGDPAVITAKATNAEGDPFGEGELTINFTDPEVVEFFPNCVQACVNALPWAMFNIAMDASTLNSSNVSIYKCGDSLCARSELESAFVSTSVAYDSITRKASVVFPSDATLLPNTWYRVVLDGDEIKGQNGNPLSTSGSNYGTDDNGYFVGDFSWKFKTKESGVSCSIDSVEVQPEAVTLNVIGERQEYSASAYGAPDACSVNGQTLQASSFTWSQWSAIDTPNNVPPSSGSANNQSGIVAYMMSDGEIALSGELPAYCTSNCLNAGATVTINDGVCGNGILEQSEECDDGRAENGDGCSSQCLNEGSDSCVYRCAMSNVFCSQDNDCAEVCEENECTISGNDCVTTNDCPYRAGDSCEISNAPCCGDLFWEWSPINGGEDCEDGNTVSGDGCSSSCRNEGSRSVDALCGDSRDWVQNEGGEDCDDGNTASGDGCSANCLKEGSVAAQNVYAICGNNIIESGEDCDGGNAVAGDGCSGECLNEGRNQCVYVCSVSHASCTTTANCPVGQTCGPLIAPCCGNSVVESGEDCDGGMSGAEGCSQSCLLEGASVNYSIASFCGDGDDDGIGEECDALSSAEFLSGPYSVAQIATGAPQEVNEQTGYAVSQVGVIVGGKSGTASLQLQCSCTTNDTCGNSLLYACGENSCCFERPTLGVAYPPFNIGSSGEGYCRNTAVWVEFSQDMDEETFNENLYLQLLSVAGNEVDSQPECPSGYTYGQIASAYSSLAPLARVWNWLKEAVSGFFAQEAQAIAPEAMAPQSSCYLPVSYDEVEMLDGRIRVNLRYGSLLVANAIYELNVVSDNTPSNETRDGVLSADGAVLCIGEICNADNFSQMFYVGEDICELDRVVVDDAGKVGAAEYESLSKRFFSATGENHLFVATPQTLRGSGAGYEEISPLTGFYEWSWGWTSSVADTKPENVISIASGGPASSTTKNFVAAGNDGKEIVIATAQITLDEIFDVSTEGNTKTGFIEVTALVCENPWPSLTSKLGFPFADVVSNFSFYYCRDAGEDGTADDLPALDDPIEVSSLASADILNELIFKVSGSSDAIGVRVIANDGAIGANEIANSGYLSPSVWVEALGFTGSFEATQLDGYEAVESGSTIYAAAANQSADFIYPNIYVVSYNENAGEAASEIFSRILNNWRFNSNDEDVSDVNLCAAGDDYVMTSGGNYLDCSWDGDCFETCENNVCAKTGFECEDNNDCTMGGASAWCDAQKAKLRRDMKRLTDVTDLVAALDSYGEQNGHCSVTKGQQCNNDDDCYGDEVCVAGYPTLQSGSYVPALTNSKWDSWNSGFANALGQAAPQDPVNEFYSCDEDGYESTTCWNGETGTFVCSDRSHVYGYQSVGGEEYILYSQLESIGMGMWSYDIDASAADSAEIIVEYPLDYAPSASGMPLPDGFETSAVFCDAGAWGASTLCGDGVKGPAENCEIGDILTIENCTASTGAYGTMAVACLGDCSRYQTEIEAEASGAQCEPYDCGNGIVEIEAGELCDDGELNGTYGHCDDDCQMAAAYFCGDGYLAGGEQCDCGTVLNFSSLLAQASSWSVVGPSGGGNLANPWCDVSNGQWSQEITTSCSYDCKQPGPSCGDGLINGGETCDGGYEEWNGRLCANGDTCVSDSDCKIGVCGAGGEQVGIGRICEDYIDVGSVCTENGDCDSGACVSGVCAGGAADTGAVCNIDAICDSGVCSVNTYPLYRFRVCDDSCYWDGWEGPVGGNRVCGNGVKEGNEVCDDGNTSNSDGCLNTCEENICGDGFVYLGLESCDNAGDNGEICEAPYGGVCHYCNAQCQYKTATGGYCGDGLVNGNEQCDGEYSMVYSYFDAQTDDKLPGTCNEYGVTTIQAGNKYTCRWLGVCNGGEEQGEFCTPNPSNPKLLETSGDDTDDCMNGTCVRPMCADNCASSCPMSYQLTDLLIQSELANAQPLESVSLYSYQNANGNSPDSAVLFVPACSVATRITADVSKAEAVLPNVDIVYVTDLTISMNPNLSSGVRRINSVIDATKSSIASLFDAYANTDAEVNIGLVSYSSQYRGDFTPASPGYDFCNSDSESIEFDGAWVDSPLSISSPQAVLYSTLDSYASCVCLNCVNGQNSGRAPIYRALQAAVAELEDSDADLKIVALVAGGIDYYDETYYSSTSLCPGDTKVYAGNSYSGTQACYAEIADDIISESNSIIFFTTMIGMQNQLKGYMSHISSNRCDWDETVASRGIDSVTDCEGGYALSATTEEGIAQAYSTIIDSIVGGSITMTVNSIESTSGVAVGNDVLLPIPEGFACEDSSQMIPMYATFAGGETLQLSDVQLMYCSAE